MNWPWLTNFVSGHPWLMGKGPVVCILTLVTTGLALGVMWLLSTTKDGKDMPQGSMERKGFILAWVAAIISMIVMTYDAWRPHHQNLVLMLSFFALFFVSLCVSCAISIRKQYESQAKNRTSKTPEEKKDNLVSLLLLFFTVICMPGSIGLFHWTWITLRKLPWNEPMIDQPNALWDGVVFCLLGPIGATIGAIVANVIWMFCVSSFFRATAEDLKRWSTSSFSRRRIPVLSGSIEAINKFFIQRKEHSK